MSKILLTDIQHEIARQDLPVELEQHPNIFGLARITLTDDTLATEVGSRHLYPSSGDQTMSVVQLVAEWKNGQGDISND